MSLLGNLGSPLAGNFRDSWRALEREHSSLRELCWGVSFLGIRKKGSGDGHHSSVSGGVRLPGTLKRLWEWGIPFHGSSFRGTWKGSSFGRGPEVFERKALGMGISHEGSFGQPGLGSSTGDLEIWLKGALGVECLSLSLGAL